MPSKAARHDYPRVHGTHYIAARLLAPRFCPQQKADITSIPVKLILIKPATLHIYMVRLHGFTPAVGIWGSRNLTSVLNSHLCSESPAGTRDHATSGISFRGALHVYGVYCVPVKRARRRSALRKLQVDRCARESLRCC